MAFLVRDSVARPRAGTSRKKISMNLSMSEIEEFLRTLADEVGAHRLGEFCQNYAACPVDLDCTDYQTAEMQDLFQEMLRHCDRNRLRAILQAICTDADRYTDFLLRQ
jgi:predicted NAD-dependent protein-ADP-ribosyltransferase YbiA (DUF1768 family)